MPAANPARTPPALSSMTMQSAGATPSRDAANKKIPGAGFPCVTSSAL